MISLDDAARQMGAAFQMAAGREGWRDKLDCSVDGVFRSFTAIVFAAPAAFAAVLSGRRASKSSPDLPADALAAAPLPLHAAAEFVAFGLDWALGLAVLLIAARTLKADRGAAPLIAGYNWAQPLVLFAAAPALALVAVTGSSAASVFLIPVLAFNLALYWGIIRRGLGLEPAPTLGLLVFVVFAGFIADEIVSGAAKALFFQS